jgi:phosphohistidine phosphatase
MELYLMQHGASFSKDVHPEQPLSPVGREQIEMSGAAMRRMGLGLELMLCSPKARSLETASIIAEYLNYPPENILASEALLPSAPPDQALALLGGYAKLQAVFVAGHLPNLAELAATLLSSGAKVRLQFDNGGLCRLDLPMLPTDKAILRYFLTPFQLQLMADTRRRPLI